MKKLLITGGYGLVGSNICKLLERDYPDIEVTKVKHKHNIHDDTLYDFIIHAAGYGQPGKFGEDKHSTIAINTMWVGRLFECLKHDGKLLFISSSEIYENTMPQHPRGCYIEGKRCGEAICTAYREQGVDVKIARLALAYGPGYKKDDTRVLNQFVEQAVSNKHIQLRDKGEAMRTYLYIDDAVKIMLDILFNGKELVYDVGGTSRVSILGLAEAIAKLTDSTVSLGDAGDTSAPKDVSLDMSWLKDFMFTSLEEGLKQTIEWQKSF